MYVAVTQHNVVCVGCGDVPCPRCCSSGSRVLRVSRHDSWMPWLSCPSSL